MSRERWSVEIRRTRPGDGWWPYRWQARVYDDEHHDPFGRGRMTNVFFREPSASRWARRYILKVERSEASERTIRGVPHA